jgi:hypothetical protein
MSPALQVVATHAVPFHRSPGELQICSILNCSSNPCIVTHADAPGALYVPATQSSHAAALVLPGALYVPAGQVSHAATPQLAQMHPASLYRPAGQFRQALHSGQHPVEHCVWGPA